jgi:hypothetical protein
MNAHVSFIIDRLRCHHKDAFLEECELRYISVIFRAPSFSGLQFKGCRLTFSKAYGQLANHRLRRLCCCSDKAVANAPFGIKGLNSPGWASLLPLFSRFEVCRSLKTGLDGFPIRRSKPLSLSRTLISIRLRLAILIVASDGRHRLTFSPARISTVCLNL